VCHPEVPAGAPIPDVRVEDAAIPVEDGPMAALLALPERVPAPGILIINDVFGRSPFYDQLARRLAQAGFVAVTPEYFFREGSLPEPTRDAATARAKQLDFKRWGRDMSAAIDWLRTRPEVNRRVGTIGFCMGGTQVLLLSARREDITATVSYYGFPADARTGASPIELAPKMRGPVLGHWGDQDAGAGMDNVEKLRAALQAAGVEHEFQIYPGLGHGFLKASLEDDKTPGYAQACTSWTRTLGFYRRRLMDGADQATSAGTSSRSTGSSAKM
jgi:carboxymethylenebutenolidase